MHVVNAQADAGGRLGLAQQALGGMQGEGLHVASLGQLQYYFLGLLVVGADNAEGLGVVGCGVEAGRRNEGTGPWVEVGDAVEAEAAQLPGFGN